MRRSTIEVFSMKNRIAEIAEINEDCWDTLANDDFSLDVCDSWKPEFLEWC